MPAVPHPTLPKAAKPRLSTVFDTWNSSATGHQRPEQRPGTGWRDSRSTKLSSQFKAGGRGGERLLHVNPFYKYGDEEDEENTQANKSVVDMLRAPGSMSPEKKKLSREEQDKQAERDEARLKEMKKNGEKIFSGLTIYVNGSTYPAVSDHKLKQMLVHHGAGMSMHLGRRKVTHVVVGRTGLAGGKMEKEIKRVRGCGIKYVGVEW